MCYYCGSAVDAAFPPHRERKREREKQGNKAREREREGEEERVGVYSVEIWVKGV